jgi:hypothetical protein
MMKCNRMLKKLTAGINDKEKNEILHYLCY